LHQWFFTVFVDAENFASSLDPKSVGLHIVFDLERNASRDCARGNVSDSIGEGGFPPAYQECQKQCSGCSDRESNQDIGAAESIKPDLPI
jgi:hypothetical protein